MVFETVTLGVELYNTGNQEGCFRLYQGSLMGITQLLDHRADLLASVNKQLTAAKTQPAAQGAFALRKVLDEVQLAVTKKKPLWERLGGEAAVKLVVHDFVVAAAADPKVNFFRDGKYKLDDAGVAKLEKLLVELISAVSGGPLKYSGRDMKTSHAGMKITEAEFNAIAGHLVATLKKYKVAQTEIDDLVGIVAETKKDIVEK
jgi:hemoglobin